LGLDCLQPILWNKIANGVTEAEGNGAGFYGKPYQPGGIVKNDIEYILFLRKGGEYRTTPTLQKALSMLSRDEMKTWFRSIWSDLRGASTREGHPAPYPMELAERLIKMFSFAGDTVLDPFAGTGSTSQAAIITGRNSIANEIEPAYVDIARQRITRTARQYRLVGAIKAEVIFDGDTRATRTSARRTRDPCGAAQQTAPRLLAFFLRLPFGMRKVLKSDQRPVEIKPQQESVWICMCGLSKNQPFCDGSHKTTRDEEDGKTYEYDAEGHRHEV